MKEEKKGFSGEYVTDIGTRTSLPESNKEDMVVSDLVTSTSQESISVEGTSGSSVEPHQGATSDYYVAKPKRADITARIIDD
jgi:hypothetical protein